MSAKSRAPSDASIGTNVRAHRLARGLSQGALARELGVTFQQVQKYEQGRNRISGGRLTRIAAVLGVPLAALFEGVDTGAQAQPASPLPLHPDPQALRLLQAFARVRDGGARKLIVALVERMACDVKPLGEMRIEEARELTEGVKVDDGETLPDDVSL